MRPLKASLPLCALALLGSLDPPRSTAIEATEVCRRCPPVVSSYSAPCGPQVSYRVAAPCRCGPIRRLLGLCCPRPPVCPPPCRPCAVPVAPPVVTFPPGPTAPAPGLLPSGPPPDAPGGLRPDPSFGGPDRSPPLLPPSSGSSFQYRPAPAPVPGRPLTPPLPPRPIRLDRIVSFPGG
jgi:hypothetical protein